MPLFKIFPKNQTLQWLFKRPLFHHSFLPKEESQDLPAQAREFTNQMLKGIFERPNQRC